MAEQVMVEILGRHLTLQSSVPAETLQAVARMVDEQLRELQKVFPASPLADLAILAALNLACETMEIREEHQKLVAEIDARSRRLLKRLEGFAAATPPGP
ncbi:MAG: cell division protein ZapA [Syntrophobacterales bacterium]|nr:cell division protein ZapA [Syntrophobacterales bacterium]